MKHIASKAKQLQQTLIEEEFRLWDAKRNDCSEHVIDDINDSIKNAKADLIALEIFFHQSMLS